METLAVSCTVAPALAGFRELVSTVTVGICRIVSTSAVEALVALLASPL